MSARTLESEIVLIPAGDVIFRQGDAGDCAYIVEQGSVDIVLEGAPRRLVATRGSGEIFGEMAIVDGGLRSASAMAHTDCRLLPVAADRLSRYLEEADPVLRLVVDAMLTRLREALNPDGAADGSASSALASDAAARQAIMLNAIGRIHRENDFRRALDRSEIALFYQPIVSLSSGDIVGFEALARWHHPERGIVMPGEFIPLAESSGMIGQLTRQCLQQALTAFPALDAAASAHPAVFVNVNVSGHDLADGEFADFLEAVTLAQPQYRQRLKIEITESALMERPDVALRTLQRCRDLGIGIAIDDFGTGYSSLAYLHTLPIDVLKIDRSFVRAMTSDPQSAKIISTIIRLAEGLGLPVVSEGLEVLEDVGILTGLGCDFGQGYHFARPMPLADAGRLLTAWQGRTAAAA